MIDKLYGMDSGIINLVKNEMQKSDTLNVTAIFNKAVTFFPSNEFTVVDIEDLTYHLRT